MGKSCLPIILPQGLAASITAAEPQPVISWHVLQFFTTTPFQMEPPQLASCKCFHVADGHMFAMQAIQRICSLNCRSYDRHFLEDPSLNHTQPSWMSIRMSRVRHHVRDLAICSKTFVSETKKSNILLLYPYHCFPSKEMYLHFHFLMTFNNTLSWLNTVSMDTQCCFFNAARVGMAGSVPGNCQECSLIINEGKLPPVIIFMKLLSFGE